MALFFTKLLYPKLKAAADADASSSESRTGERTRVVWTSSTLVDSAALTNGIDFAAVDTGLQKRMANYAMSKAGDVGQRVRKTVREGWDSQYSGKPR